MTESARRRLTVPRQAETRLRERDVLAFPAAEVAGMLGTSTVAVKSTLQRARARLEQVAPTAEEVSEPAEPEVRILLEAYIAAFENADPAALERVLRKDAAIEPVGSLSWFSGRDTCLRYITQFLGAAGDWRMAATSANGQPAAAAYLRGPDGIHRAFGLAVLTATGTGITRITVFGDPGLVARFGFPPVP
jgi:RNA polymerase sigma-70 factor, ECF subfamily